MLDEDVQQGGGLLPKELGLYPQIPWYVSYHIALLRLVWNHPVFQEVVTFCPNSHVFLMPFMNSIRPILKFLWAQRIWVSMILIGDIGWVFLENLFFESPVILAFEGLSFNLDQGYRTKLILVIFHRVFTPNIRPDQHLVPHYHVLGLFSRLKDITFQC